MIIMYLLYFLFFGFNIVICQNSSYENLIIDKEMYVAVSWYDIDLPPDAHEKYCCGIFDLSSDYYCYNSPYFTDFMELININGYDSIKNIWIVNKDYSSRFPKNFSVGYRGRENSIPYQGIYNHYMFYFLEHLISFPRWYTNYNYSSCDTFPKLVDNCVFIPMSGLREKSFNNNECKNYYNDVYVFRCNVTYLILEPKEVKLPILHSYENSELIGYYSNSSELYESPYNTDRRSYTLPSPCDLFRKRRVIVNSIHNITNIEPVSFNTLIEYLTNSQLVSMDYINTLLNWNKLMRSHYKNRHHY